MDVCIVDDIYIQKQLWIVADLTIEISFCYVVLPSMGTCCIICMIGRYLSNLFLDSLNDNTKLCFSVSKFMNNSFSVYLSSVDGSAYHTTYAFCPSIGKIL